LSPGQPDVSIFAQLAEDAARESGRTVRPGQITPILEQAHPGWYIDREGRMLGVNLLACQVCGADRPGELYGTPISQAFVWSQPLHLSVRVSARETRDLQLQARLRLVEGDWGAVLEMMPEGDDAETADLLHTWQKRAVRLWGARSYVQYDLSRFREYAFALKEVGLTRHRGRRDELAPHAVIALVSDALDEPDPLWKRVSQVAERTGLPADEVNAAIRCLSDFGGEIVRAPLLSGSSRQAYTTREHLARTAPRWQRVVTGLGEWRPTIPRRAQPPDRD